MLNKIAITAVSRFFNALLSFAIVAIAARIFGAEGYGTIVLLILGITFIQLVNNFVGGSALIYLVPRERVGHLFLLSYAWALIVAVIGANLLFLFKLIPPEFRHETMLLSLISSWASINMMIILGRERIKLYNILSVLQTLLIFCSILFFVFILKRNSIDYYIYALYIAYLSTFLISLISIRTDLIINDISTIGNSIKPILQYGGLIQLANIFQFFNYRLSYYFLEKFSGKSELGKFAIGVQLAEGIWILAKSVALVQYARLSNEPDNPEYAKNTTLIFLKLTVSGTLIMLAVLLALPQSVFTWIFGADFINIRSVILILSPGILALAACNILSHYFSGTGRPGFNTISSAIGFAVVIISGFILIPGLGIIGAGLATTLSHLSVFIYQAYWFKKISKSTFKEITFTASDLKKMVKELKAILPDSKSTPEADL